MQSCLQEGGDNVWRQIAPLLNDAIASLGEKDRNAIVLRYIEGMNLKEVGAALGTTEDAAKKRIFRAVEKLRILFARRGIALSATVLTGCIAARSVEAAPGGLVAAITATVLKGTVLTTSISTLVKGTLKVMAWTKAKIAVGVGVAAVLAVQWHEIAIQKRQLALLQAQPSANANEEAAPVPVASQEANQLRAEKMKLANEVAQLRGQLALQKSRRMQAPQPEIKLSQVLTPENPGRQLGLAVAQGDPTALDKLLVMAKAEHESFNTNSAGLNDTERSEFSRRTFAPLQAAFDAITEAAATGNKAALLAVTRALQLPELKGNAIQSVGVLAGNGDEAALEILLHPKEYDILPSGAVGALKPAADHGYQNAIDALAAVAADEGQQALWYMAADGLGKAAGSGNSVAVDALIALSATTNQSVQTAVLSGLTQAAANQNAKAADALRQINAR